MAWDAAQGRLSLRYHGTLILDGRIRAEDAAGKAVAGAEVKFEPAETRDPAGKVEQRLKFTLAKPQEGVKLVLNGTVTGSGEAIPTETSGAAQQRFPLVRNSVGLSRNLRNNALYDRQWDWLLAGPADGATRILPKQAGKEQRTDFILRKAPAPRSSWCSAPASIRNTGTSPTSNRGPIRCGKAPSPAIARGGPIRYDFTQKTLDELTDVFAAKKLPDFGYKYIQLDDTYQTGNGSCPQNWLTWNQKFPGGADYALKKIKSSGMEGGIWVHRVHRPTDPNVADIGKQHPDWFVKKADGSLFMDGGFYILNTRNKEAIDGMVRPIYRELKKQGWGYVKIDGAGDLLGCYKNKKCEDHFKKINSTPEESLRDWDRVAREELGKDTYILNCWGVNTGLCVVGLADGCRLAGDGFQPENLANNSTYEGVVWRNDPDHCDILGSWLTDEKAMMPVFGTRRAGAGPHHRPPRHLQHRRRRAHGQRQGRGI